VQACCWVDVHGRTAATPAELDALLSRPADSAAAPELYDIDHVHVAAGGGGTATAVLYGPIGTQCFAELHAKLVAAVSATGAVAPTCLSALLVVTSVSVVLDALSDGLSRSPHDCDGAGT
jgi:CBS domain containing-hemolysin-like protein